MILSLTILILRELFTLFYLPLWVLVRSQSYSSPLYRVPPLQIRTALFLLSFDSQGSARTTHPPLPVVPETFLQCLTIIHVPRHWTVYPVYWSWTFSLASFGHNSYSVSLVFGLIALSFICLVPFGTQCCDRLLLSTMFPEVVCHSTSCACLVVASSILNLFWYGVVCSAPVIMYYFLFVSSCLFLWPLPPMGYLRLSLIGGPFFCRIHFVGLVLLFGVAQSSLFRFIVVPEDSPFPPLRRLSSSWFSRWIMLFLNPASHNSSLG